MAEGGEIESLQLETEQLTVRAPARRRPRRRPEGAPPAPGAPPGGSPRPSSSGEEPPPSAPGAGRWGRAPQPPFFLRHTVSSSNRNSPRSG